MRSAAERAANRPARAEIYPKTLGPPVAPMPPARRRTLKISRFIVMAMLQAARARRLGLEESSAHSWGLNRAIFYAAAKQGFRGTPGSGKTGEPTPAPRPDETYPLGDDFAYRDPTSATLRFRIGGEAQTEEVFRRQIAERFGSEANFRKAWAEATSIVSEYDETVLKSGRQFYATVYRPRRDDLAAAWTARYVPDAAGTSPKS